MPCSNPGKPLERTAFDPGPREVARGDKPYLRKSTDRKAQIRKAFVQFRGLICALRSVDFLR